MEEQDGEGSLVVGGVKVGGDGAGSALALLRGAAGAAGATLQAGDAAVRGRPAAEVCYSRATVGSIHGIERR
jgi:hypothetical protein